MVTNTLPKIGQHIPIEKFHVSKFNVRHHEPFGDSEDDTVLIHQLSLGNKIVEAFKARPEGDEYGVYVGRRRFLAKKATGAKAFVVGEDVLIRDISDEDARQQSLIENLKILRKEMNPITRAKTLNEIISSSTTGVRGTARKLGIAPSTLSDWLQVLELSPKMQEAVARGAIYYTDALNLVRAELGDIGEEKMAEVLENEGLESFKKELTRIMEKKGAKRGIPPGKYIISRITWDKVYKPDMEIFEKLSKMAESKNMKVEVYCKKVLEEHARSGVG